MDHVNENNTRYITYITLNSFTNKDNLMISFYQYIRIFTNILYVFDTQRTL